ncbi:MAG TPA: CCA tRNA nucleotidyltransferase, partial [Hyphomicrobiaceae bacterium]|nr:CCA tRNA nucleotidyltransferase [Hyphomicrobiaceae bacterium]
ARVAFSRDWATDAARRDFTINAIYCDGDGTIHDLVGGVADCARRRIRFIGEARVRIREDYLRILRFFRFHAQLGGGAMEADGLAASIAERDGLQRLSMERIAGELRKLLVGPNVVSAIAAMMDCGLLPSILRAAPRPALLSKAAAVEAAAGVAASPTLRLSALAVAVAEDVDRLADHLKLAGCEREALLPIRSGIDVTPTLTDAERRRSLYRLGAQAWRRHVFAAWIADGRIDEPSWLELLGLPERWPVPKLPVDGQSLIAAGLSPGPSFGAILKDLETAWIASDFTLDRAALLKLVPPRR